MQCRVTEVSIFWLSYSMKGQVQLMWLQPQYSSNHHLYGHMLALSTHQTAQYIASGVFTALLNNQYPGI